MDFSKLAPQISVFGIVAVAILFAIFTTVLFKKFTANDSIVNVIHTRLDAIESFPKYADFYSTNSNVLSSNVAYAITWAGIQASNDSNFSVNGIGGPSFSNAIIVPVTGVYQVTSTIQIASSNASNSCLAYYQSGSLSDTLVPNSIKKIQFQVSGGSEVIEIVLSQIMSLATTDKLSTWVNVGNAGTQMYRETDLPSARLSIVRLS